MKKLFSFVLFSFLLSIIFFSCNKDDAVSPGNGNNNNTGPITQTFSSNITTPIPIAPNTFTSDSLNANITFGINASNVSDVKLNLNTLEGVIVSNLRFALFHNGVEVFVIDNPLTVSGTGNITNLVLSDSSSNQLSNVNSYPISGIYRPQHLLSSFDNLGASGYWTLRIINSGSVRTGVIKSWGITLSYSPLPVTSWQLISTHTLVNEEWRDVYFTDVNNFWGCGNSNGVGSIYRSTNGGLNWNIAYRDSSNYNSIKSIYFINSSTGFACGDGGMIYSTFNGGQNWSPQYITGSTNLRCIRFLNSSTGLVCGGDNLPEIYKTTNGGLSWFGGITSGVSFLECICFADANTAYAGGDWDILKSIDGGNTWSILITQGSVYRGEFPSIQFLNANTGYVAAGRDGVLYTSNGGVNWSSRIPNTGFGIRGLFCTDINNCYVGGGDSTMTNGKIYKSTNSGLTWNLQLTDPNIFIGKIQFLDANTGFAGGSDGQSGTKVVLYKTTNGGGKK